MVQDGCWSTVICSARERAELGDTSDGGWVLGCRLSIGHQGDHASDAENVPRFDRRLWLEWNDRDQHAQSLIDRKPCSGGVGARCMLFEGHGGVHWYAPSNGHLTSAGTGRRRSEERETSGRSSLATVEQTQDSDHRGVGQASSAEPVAEPTGEHDVVGAGSHRSDDAAHDVDSRFVSDIVAEVADIPNLRGRAVRGHSAADRLESIPTPTPRRAAGHDVGSPSVTEALDAVVAALAQLAEALRRSENDRQGREPA